MPCQGALGKPPWPAEPFSTLTLPISPVTATTMGDPLNLFFTLLLPTIAKFVYVAYRERFHFCYA